MHVAHKHRLFAKLRGAFMEKGIDQEYVAEYINRSVWYVTRRMCGHEDWLLSEMYALLDLVKADPEELHEYFPKGGNSI